MKPNTLITAEKLKEIAAKAENFDDPEVKKEPQTENINIPENESLDQMAVRELLQDAIKKEKTEDEPNLVVPINAKPVINGQAEVKTNLYNDLLFVIFFKN